MIQNAVTCSFIYLQLKVSQAWRFYIAFQVKLKQWINHRQLWPQLQHQGQWRSRWFAWEPQRESANRGVTMAERSLAHDWELTFRNVGSIPGNVSNFSTPDCKKNKSKKALSVWVMVICSDHRRLWRTLINLLVTHQYCLSLNWARLLLLLADAKLKSVPGLRTLTTRIFLMVILRVLDGIRTGPFTLSSFSFAQWINSEQIFSRLMTFSNVRVTLIWWIGASSTKPFWGSSNLDIIAKYLLIEKMKP